ncbi:MAG: adenylate/guanylate cyclase domain-containing protein [Betaproteobacteria bacterium]|nr:adenylate/guanylate cyclase domain-containing protein [Betaproteobacteria bacterium]
MSEAGLRQRLAAILAADAAGYSRLMAEDERATVAALDAARSVFRTQIEANQGRVIDMAGDSVLALFDIAAGAVTAALAVQQKLIAASSAVPEDRRMRFRVGIHLGDVIEKGDGTVYGDGVNIAARLEGLAEPGGITVSESIRTAVKGKVSAAFEDQGEQKVKNIADPVRAYRVKREGDAATRPSTTVGAIDLSLPDKLSIAVLPFENMSSDPEQGYFGDGLAEDIITALSKISSLFVIARNSSFAYKGQPTDVRKISRELGVRYVLEGSIRATKNQIRITGQLIDAIDGHHLWAERYDRKLDDIFAIQDEMTREIVTALRLRLSDGESAQIWLGGTRNVDAWTYALSALDLTLNGTPGGTAQGRVLYEKAIAADPGYASAIATVGLSHILDHHFGFSQDRDRSLRLAEEYTDRALVLESNLPLAHGAKGMVALYHGRHEEAVREAQLAVRLSPSDAFIKIVFARILIDLGRPQDAEAQLREGMRLNPFCPVFYYGILANALELQQRDAEAMQILERALARNPNYFSGHLRLASLLGLAGRLEKARTHAQEAMRINPRFDAGAVKSFYKTGDRAVLAKFTDGLKKAGLSFDGIGTDQ